ncbi:zn-finger in ubiquitin-hydrolase [Colletotrichum truncatum]|uniref:Zn-finger in ubiquitin-hydrolase n=1 Tax=Colletotrichum truncatum TaxID=5467 RepID=A0ACC3ZD00_COLTU|nr:zn-finger in ubiquitin-hydrolase [Colletotrichum truncatum]KAF6797848.1 zn-finger in ubiquitin-hydrolase [Colletotrichum truncatum]
MRTFFYHLKFELYPTPNPVPSDKISKGKAQASFSSKEVWVPPKGTDIFDELPAHSRKSSKRSYSFRPQPSPLQSYEAPFPADTYRSSELRDLSTSGTANLIDCGPSRAPVKEDSGRNIERITEKQWRARTQSFPPPPSSAAIRPETAVRDWRFGQLSIQSIDLEGNSDQMAAEGASSSAALGVGPTFVGTTTKAKYVPLETKNTDIGWGVVHFYREEEETPELGLPHSEDDSNKTEDCTTLCIPAVPSYLTPSDFLGYVGEKWRDDISHYRMVMTARMNRYLVLLKFRDSDRARKWQREFDGKVFNSMEAQVCHVVFVKSITFETPTRENRTFPDLTHDPFTPSSSVAASSSLKPFPPPTPNLVELPTCPVCLERMDDTTGLMTIPCQHVFHCTCLQNWKGSGCPVCRHTNPETIYDPSNPYTQPFGSSASNLCSVCDSTDDLWICLICGNVGCGRYKGGHAKDHWKETAHSFALELETQHVWDYAGDTWVHRLIRDKGDGKVVELPGSNGHHHRPEGGFEDLVPRAKLDNIGLEYTHLLTSQLESQRVYFEEMLSKVADKASKAAATAESASAQASIALEENSTLKAELARLKTQVIPQLERDAERDRMKATKSQELARNLSKALQEEKEVTQGLMKRVEHNNAEVEALRQKDGEYKAQIADLEEMNRDLTMFISGQEKLKELENEGKVEAGEIAEGSVSVPDKKGKRRARK